MLAVSGSQPVQLLIAFQFLQVGDIINVTKQNINGQCEGELNNKVGHFPFTHIEFIESDGEPSTNGQTELVSI